jgi:AraC family transcriptional regulator of adaptative response/methylated-DNA-[protein]-cysteine methyltransferase
MNQTLIDPELAIEARTASPLKTRFLSDDARWQALLKRDAAADGQFFYSVKTTGVYCRPVCPARLAKRINVDFHDSCAAAERAGFRPCQRCRPDQASLRERQARLITTACKQMDEAESAPAPALAELAQQAQMSSSHFHRLFKSLTGMTPKAYARTRRSAKVRAELEKGGRHNSAPGKAPITQAIYNAGYNASSRFYAEASAALGMHASDYRQGGRGQQIRFAMADCALGTVLIAATERGVCAVQFGDDPAVLMNALQDRFARAELVGADPEFEAMVAQVLGLLQTPHQAHADELLPLDLRGTAFQHKVWRALLDIPAGTTLSYAELARRIGQPTATRAIAQACAANPVAVVVPCHRVIRQDGQPGGYRWGVERKQILLERESAVTRNSKDQ